MVTTLGLHAPRAGVYVTRRRICVKCSYGVPDYSSPDPSNLGNKLPVGPSPSPAPGQPLKRFW